MYYAKVNWFSDYAECDLIYNVFFFADDWNDAMAKINARFMNINSIEMRALNCEDFIFVPETFVDTILNTN